MAKSSKQKCLEMWQWLAANPTKYKRDYYTYLESINKQHEYNDCWACEEDNKYTGDCLNCPITWFDDNDNDKDCLHPKSPYYTWTNTIDSQICQQAAQDIVNLIQTTWKEA